MEFVKNFRIHVLLPWEQQNNYSIGHIHILQFIDVIIPIQVYGRVCFKNISKQKIDISWTWSLFGGE